MSSQHLTLELNILLTTFVINHYLISEVKVSTKFAAQLQRFVFWRHYFLFVTRCSVQMSYSFFLQKRQQ